MKKSFIVKFPIHQEYSSGLSWAQINELSWVEVNLLSWKDLTVLCKRYLEYSIKYVKKMTEAIQFALKKVR